MYNQNVLNGVIGQVADISSANKAIIQFELHGAVETAFLTTHRFYKNGKRLPDNQSLNKYIKLGHKVKFSCHINDHPEPGQCRWYITNCWRLSDTEEKVVMLSGMMNVAGTVTDLKQRHGTLGMTDQLGNEYRVHFLASRVYLYGKRLSSSKPLASQLHVDDKVYFDAIPCFPEENNHNCNWFATCVHKGKKPETFTYKDSSNTTEVTDLDKERIFNQLVESIKGDEKTARGDTPTGQMETGINGLIRDVDNLGFHGDASPAHSQMHESPVHEIDSNTSGFDSVFKQTTGEERHVSELSAIGETEYFKDDFNQKVEPARLTAHMLQDIKMLTNNPRMVFAKSEGIILSVINEEYGVILGEFQRNVFQNILFHRSNAFLFKMSLAKSKLTEIFIEGDRVRFIAINAPNQLACDWIATQVSVACHESEEQDESDEDSLLEDEFE